MQGNEDRRGGGVDHPQILATMEQHVGKALDATVEVKLMLSAAKNWLRGTGLTGYYKTERDNAEQALVDAQYAADHLSGQIAQALTEMQKIQ